MGKNQDPGIPDPQHWQKDTEIVPEMPENLQIFVAFLIFFSPKFKYKAEEFS
jgi:hypothetical protein